MKHEKPAWGTGKCSCLNAVCSGGKFRHVQTHIRLWMALGRKDGGSHGPLKWFWGGYHAQLELPATSTLSAGSREPFSKHLSRLCGRKQ